MYLVGIDVGTTNTKTVIFDVETGRICAVGSSRTIARHPVPEWSEFDAEDLWGTVLRSIQAAVQHCDRHSPWMLMETYCTLLLPGMTSEQSRRHNGGRTSPVESASLPLRDIFHAQRMA